MTVRFPGFLAGIVVLASSSACSIARPPAELFDDLATASAVDPSFQPGLKTLNAAGAQGRAQQPHHSLLLGVKVSSQNREDIWFVRLSSAASIDEAPRGIHFAPFAVPIDVGSLTARMRLIAPAERIWVETFDAQGELIQSSLRSVPVGLAGVSVTDLCRFLHVESSQTTQAGTPSVDRTMMAALLIKLHVIGSSRSLRTVQQTAAKSVIRTPGMLEFVTSGFSRRVQFLVHETQLQIKSPAWLPWGVAQSEVRFQMQFAGQAILNGRLVAGETAAPFNLTGGMVMLDVVHPEKPQNRLMVRVLAATGAKP